MGCSPSGADGLPGRHPDCQGKVMLLIILVILSNQSLSGLRQAWEALPARFTSCPLHFYTLCVIHFTPNMVHSHVKDQQGCGHEKSILLCRHCD